MKTTHYIALTFAPLTEPQQDITIAGLYDFDHLGMEQTETGVRVFFEQEAFPEAEIKAMADRLGLSYTKELLPTVNWNATWEQNFEPVRIGDFCYVRAHFHPPVSGLQYDLVITPKMSFGTGHHATTEMMIASMEDLDIRGKRVFDFGTGTGILAILAEKMGAANIMAIDNEPGAVENARENAQLNACDKCAFAIGSLDAISNQQFDLILANINRNILMQYMPDFPALLSSSGRLLLSGILESDIPDIRASAETQGLRLLKKRQQKEWACLLFEQAGS